MLQYKDIRKALADLHVQRHDVAIVHVPNSLLGQVRGGAQTMLGAVLASIDNILVPSFTFQTMVIPEIGPGDNWIDYGSRRVENLDAAFFAPDLACSESNSQFSEQFRCFPDVNRSSHPLLSFLALGLDSILLQQTIQAPYGHIQGLLGSNTRVLLLGSDPSSIFSLHLAEKLAGRKQFVRWAATTDGIKECPDFPGCSQGFHKVIYHLQEPYFETSIDRKNWFNLPLDHMIQAATHLMQSDPYALLCNDLHCARCNLIRKDIRQGNERNPSDQWTSII